MALFPNNDHNQGDEIETIIGRSVKVDGNFHGEGNVTVEGVVQGTLKTNHNLTIGQSAKVKAEVSAQNLFLSGEIRGNIQVTERAQLTSTAKIFGNIQVNKLSIEEGAVINGKVSMSEGHESSGETEEQKVDKERKSNQK
ncbi:MAG: bactofilin family protein [Patescibacteria group bacterium]